MVLYSTGSATSKLVFAITTMIGLTLGAADLTIERGSPHVATANESYDTVTAADAVLVGSGVTFQATTYKLTEEAVPGEGGVVRAVEIAAGGTFATDGANNNNSSTARIAVTGANAKLKKPGNSWYSTFFQKGNFEIADPDGYGLMVNLPGSWCEGAFNAAGAGVCFSGAGDVTLAAGWTSVLGQGRMYCNKGLRFENTGKVVFQGDALAQYVINANDIFSDNVTEVEVKISNKDAAPTALTVNDGFTMRAKNLSAYADNGGYCSGAGTIQMGAQDSNGELKAAVRGDTLRFDKIGSGTLTVSSTTNMPYLTVNKGEVLVKSSLSIRELVIAEGALFIVDGCTVRVGTIDALSNGRLVTRNGGRVVVGIDSEKAVGWRVGALTLPEGVEVVKQGAGRLTIYGATGASGSFSVEGGELAFSKLGLTDQYYRFTFKQVLGWIDYFNKLQTPGHLNMRRVALYDANGTRQVSADGAILVAADGTAAKDLNPGQVTVPEGQGYQASLGTWTGGVLGWLFANNAGTGTEFTNCNLDDAADETTWQVLTVRLPQGTEALDGYNFQSYECAGVPCAWTIESSPNGVDWRTVADEANYYNPAVAKNHNAGWLNGYASVGDGTVSDRTGNLALHFDYIENGVTAGNPLSLKVSNNAVANFSAVTGGQPINEIIYDATVGGGTIRNAAFAQTGMLRITTSAGTGRIDAGTVLPLTFTDASDAANLKNWSVVIDGKVKKGCKAKLVDDKIVIQGVGLMINLR